MNHRKQFVGQLMSQFTNEMLPAISNGDPKAMEYLEKAQIGRAGAGKLPIEFALWELFEAVWIWGREAGVELPTKSNYQKDFEEFCTQLMEPWPDEAFARADLTVRAIDTGPNLKVSKRYEIAHSRS